MRNRFSHDFPAISLWVSMISPRFSYDFPTLQKLVPSPPHRHLWSRPGWPGPELRDAAKLGPGAWEAGIFHLKNLHMEGKNGIILPVLSILFIAYGIVFYLKSSIDRQFSMDKPLFCSWISLDFPGASASSAACRAAVCCRQCGPTLKLTTGPLGSQVPVPGIGGNGT